MAQRRTSICILAMLSSALIACGAPEIGQQVELDAEDAAAYTQRDGFTVPDGFVFSRGHTSTEFVGRAPWSARFEASDEFSDGVAVTAANPSFPPMMETPCSALPPGGWTSLGLTCTLTVLSTQYPPSGKLDSVTAVLTGDERGASLFLYSAGH
ncbi:hypothetical protein [Rhodococcus sp. NBC_00297]|uniref:hypothetical protein n=1 Tax=Rhodococcus sp. NBC_00297 TaxID=2976005 RepID=UPI002E2CCD3A|nr:hypothetical protein [Rhodococcus sp. NBC_00297]